MSAGDKPDLKTIIETATSLQESMKNMQKQLRNSEFSATDKQKTITVTADGRNKITDVTVTSEFKALSLNETAQAIMEAVNALKTKIDTESKLKLHAVSQGIDWPVDPATLLASKDAEQDSNDEQA